MTGMAPQQGPSPLPGGRRAEVLAVLRAAGAPLGVAVIAERLGVHPNTVRFHLAALTRAGLVERVGSGPSGPGRPPLAFGVRQAAEPAGPRGYHLLAAILAGGLAAGADPAGQAAEAGRAWGARLSASPDQGGASEKPGPDAAGSDSRVRTGTRESDPATSAVGDGTGLLMRLLGDLGFDPEWQGTRGQIGLRRCPFLELASSQGSVVCSVHLGLMRGVLAGSGAPVTVTRLEPFAEPGLCLARLGAAA